MKSLKLDHELANLVRSGHKTSTWRLFDDKDLSVDDRVVLIDKVDQHNRNSWVAFGEALLTRVVEKHLGEIGKEDYDGHEQYESPEDMLQHMQEYYGDSVSFKTPVKVLYFQFLPYRGDKPVADIQTAHDPKRVPEASTEATEANTHPKKVKLFGDGGSRGNPGPSASGFVLYDEHDNLLADKGVYLGVTTNNQAEYTALKLGLEEAHKLGALEVEVHMDSLLVVNQMKGIFKIKNRELWPLHDAIQQLLPQFKKVTFTHIPRELNKAADAAVNRALDAQLNGAAPEV